jgi:hypothetical protein
MKMKTETEYDVGDVASESPNSSPAPGKYCCINIIYYVPYRWSGR